MTSILDLGLAWVKFGSTSGQVSVKLLFSFGLGRVWTTLGLVRACFESGSGFLRGFDQVRVRFGSTLRLVQNLDSRFGSVLVRVEFGHF